MKKPNKPNKNLNRANLLIKILASIIFLYFTDAVMAQQDNNRISIDAIAQKDGRLKIDQNQVGEIDIQGYV